LELPRAPGTAARASHWNPFWPPPGGPGCEAPPLPHNDNPTRIRAARMVLVRARGAPQDGSDPRGTVWALAHRIAKSLAPRACRFVSGWHVTPSIAIRGCKPVPASHGGFMVVLRQPKLCNFSWGAGTPTRTRFSRAAGTPTRARVAAPEQRATMGSRAARRIAAHTANRSDFSTVPSASRSCARDSADPLIRPCQAHQRPRPSRASRCGQTVDEKKR
jgi:hypothetical protein